MHKKHPCPDCHACQWCSDERCRMCLKASSTPKKLSMAEQIARYEALNRNPPSRPCCKTKSCLLPED